jgi:transposase-like protein
VSTRTIYEVLAAKRIKLKRTVDSIQARLANIPAEDKETIVELYTNTKTPVKQLMDVLEINKPTLYAILDEAGATRRKSSREVEIKDTITGFGTSFSTGPVTVRQQGDELQVIIGKHAVSTFSKITFQYEV